MHKLYSLVALLVLGVSHTQLQAKFIEATQAQQYNAAIQSPKAVVMIASKDCPHCVSTKPKFINVAERNGSVNFVLLDTANPATKGIVSNLSVHSVPAFRLFKNGQLVASADGGMSEGSISAFAKK